MLTIILRRIPVDKPNQISRSFPLTVDLSSSITTSILLVSIHLSAEQTQGCGGDASILSWLGCLCAVCVGHWAKPFSSGCLVKEAQVLTGLMGCIWVFIAVVNIGAGGPGLRSE